MPPVVNVTPRSEFLPGPRQPSSSNPWLPRELLDGEAGGGTSARSASSADAAPGLSHIQAERWEVPQQRASDDGGDLPVEREEGEDGRKKKSGVFWSINFIKHVKGVSSDIF